MRNCLGALFLLATAACLQADNLAPSCGVNTLLTYEGVTCSVGIMNFSNFTFSASGTGSPTLLSASNILITPVASGQLGGGFQINAIDPAKFMVSAGQTATYFIDWFMVIDPGPFASGADLGMDPPFGNVSITQAYCPDGGLDGRGSCSTGFQSLSLSTLAAPCINPLTGAVLPSCSTHRDFDPTIANFAFIETTIVLNGSAGPSGFDSLTGTLAIVDPNATPEPITFFLTGGGLLAAGIVRKYKLSRKV